MSTAKERIGALARFARKRYGPAASKIRVRAKEKGTLFDFKNQKITVKTIVPITTTENFNPARGSGKRLTKGIKNIWYRKWWSVKLSLRVVNCSQGNLWRVFPLGKIWPIFA